MRFEGVGGDEAGRELETQETQWEINTGTMLLQQLLSRK